MKEWIDIYYLSLAMIILFQWVLIIILVCLLSKAIKNPKNKSEPKMNNQSIGSKCPSPYHEDLRTILTPDEKALAFLSNDNYMSQFKLQLCNNGTGMFLEESEAVFYKHAKQYANKHNFDLLIKPRIADIIFVPNQQYAYNENLEFSIQKKHFDFVLCKHVKDKCNLDVENIIPFLIIEIDGISHTQSKRIIRDDLVDKLIDRANEHGNNIKIVHIRRKSLDDIDTLWQTLRYKFGGTKISVGDWQAVSEILDNYTKE